MDRAIACSEYDLVLAIKKKIFENRQVIMTSQPLYFPTLRSHLNEIHSETLNYQKLSVLNNRVSNIENGNGEQCVGFSDII